MPHVVQSLGITSLADVDSADDSYPGECVVIEGIVSPSGQSGWPRNDYQVHCFQFAAWRRAGQPMFERELTILRPLARSAHDYFADFPEYSIHRMSVLLSADGTRALMEKSLPMDSPDGDLVAFGNELRKPVVVATENFGDLVLNRRLNWFEGKAQWNGRDVALYFFRNADGGIDSAIKTAQVLWSDQVQWQRKVEECAVERLLPLMNDFWLDETEAPLTGERFARRMQLESISIHEDGSFDFWHNDGDLFWGHSILVDGSLNDGCTHADIPG